MTMFALIHLAAARSVRFAVLLLAACVASPDVRAQFDPSNQDIDLFMINPGSSAERANVLILLDNTANWNQPFLAEKEALVTVSGSIGEQFNLGLMLFPETGAPNDNVDGGYVRFGVRHMTSTNQNALAGIVANLDKLQDKGNNATFSLLMYEAYAYFAGITARSGFGKVKRDYGASPLPNPYNSVASGLPGNPLSSASDQTYTSPITDACQKNFIILISNGPATDNASSLAKAQALLTGIQGSAPLQINIPSPNDGSESNWTDEYARYMSTGDCNPVIDGVQRVNTHVIEVDPGTTKSHRDHTALMKSTAAYGKGRYFSVRTGSTGQDASELVAALESIFTEIKAVNSVFASTTLPVSVNVRGTNANQAYMGVFRPEETFAPRWAGNMKLYRIGVDTSVSPPDLYLADAAGLKAESADTGFIVPQARSFWTRVSDFWKFRGTYADTDLGRESDSPDGPYVEKGGTAQRQRSVLPSARRLYTCVGACSSGDAIASYPFADANAAITQAALGAGSVAERSQIIAWTRGEDLDDENANGNTSDTRASIHGDVLHSRPAIVNYNRSGADDDNDIFVFYGANDGILRAIEGGFDAGAGTEAWGFVAAEHFGRLKRLRENTPVIGSANKKPYFFDGGVTTYTHDVDGDGRLIASDGDQVLLFLSMRRGGRYFYAFDVSDPVNPKYLWRRGCPAEAGTSGCDTGFAEIGQTWSDPTVTFLRAFSTNPVLVLGAGYDAAVEDVPPCLTSASTSSSVTTVTGASVSYSLDGTCSFSGGSSVTINRSMGRGVFVIDALSGEMLWRAGPDLEADLQLPGMTYSVAAEVIALNRDRDRSRSVSGKENIVSGYADRLYALDTGGNIWRIDVADEDATKWSGWNLAALGGGGSVPRKFLHRADVVYGSDDNGPFDAVIIGSGDREHPFDTAVVNRMYMIKDRNVGASAPLTTPSVIAEAALYDATANCLQQCTGDDLASHQAALLAAQGWYVTMRPGEKAIGAATTISGTVFFNTNQPDSRACTSTLGVAREYQMNYLNAAAVRDLNADGEIETDDRSSEHAGGGMLPEPVPILLEINDEFYQGVVSGPSVREVDLAPLGTRLRTFWHKLID
jgi:type IV pilus assembly protein PilY1